VQELHPDDPGRYVNFTHAFWSIGVLTTVLAAGGLLSAGVSWRVITGGVALIAVPPAALLFSRGSTPEPIVPVDGRTIRNQALTILRIPRFWLFFAAMFVAGGGEFCLTFWGASYIQLNFAASSWVGGVGTACFAAGMALGRTFGGYWVPQKRLKEFIVGAAAAGTMVSLFLPMTTSLPVYLALLFLCGLATAPFLPSIQSYCADRLPHVDTTMLMILLACAGIPGCGVATWLMGFIGDRSGLGRAFYLVPACYLILGLLIGWDAYVARTPIAPSEQSGLRVAKD
jgi:fucose permease